jgi:hypothetical protein
MIDPVTKQLRPKKRAGRPRSYVVADETDPASHEAAQRTRRQEIQDGFYERNPGYKKAYQDKWRAENPDKYSEYNKRSNLKLKQQVMDAYGGACACCGETELAFLTIDHINGDGAEHRRQIAAEKNTPWLQGGGNTYRWLRDHGFPEGHQVMCANCNCGKHWNGGVCPHQVTVGTLLEMPNAPAEELAEAPR